MIGGRDNTTKQFVHDPYDLSNSPEADAPQDDAFGFGSMEEGIFDPYGGMGGGHTANTGGNILDGQKQMFTEISISIFIPKDTTQMNEHFNVMDSIDDQFDSL